MPKRRKATLCSISALLIYSVYAFYFTANQTCPPLWKTKNQDLARQQRIDEWFNTHVGESDGSSGLTRLMQQKESIIYRSVLDSNLISNDLEMLHSKLAKREYEMIQHNGYYYEDVDDKEEPQIVIVSGCDHHDSDIVQKALKNRDEYASKHGYIHHFVDLDKYTNDESVAWLKIPAIREVLEKYPEAEWIWWLDIDAIIMNMDLKIGDHLLKPNVLQRKLAYGHPLRNVTAKFEGHQYPTQDEIDINDIDLIISQDSLGLNAGSFFLRKSYFTDLLLDLWSDPSLMRIKWERHEQDALIHLLLTHQSLLNHVGLVPQRLINAYHDNSMSHMWRYHPGDFVVHFAGINAERGYNSLFDYYYDVVTPPHSPVEIEDYDGGPQVVSRTASAETIKANLPVHLNHQH